MTEQERSELEQNDQDLNLDLDDIMKEFAAEEERPIQETSAQELLEAVLNEAGVRLGEDTPEDDTLRFTPAAASADISEADVTGDTAVFDPVAVTSVEEEPEAEELGDTLRFGKDEMDIIRQAAEKAEPYSENWEPEYEQPIAEYVPPQPIVFQPRSRLRELKRKLVAGPERRYYELVEQGVGRLQIAMLLCLVVVLLSGGALALNGLEMVREDRMRLMVFGQVFGMLVAALLGSFQLVNGGANLIKGRFTTDAMLLVTFVACCVDGALCLTQLRVPYCAAFSVEVLMSLWAEYQRRNTEMGQMDTMRKATRLDGVVKSPEFYEGRPGLLRSEGQVEDFMDHYNAPTTPEKIQSRFMMVGALIAVGLGIAGGLLHWDYRMGIRLGTAALLAVAPASGFVALTRPAAVLERRLHRVGAVICGWRGVSGLRGAVTVPVADEDLFPVGSVKMNGVKFFGSREPDQVVEYATALIAAEGAGLTGLFNHLLDSRNGRHFEVENFRTYNGGLGGEVEGEPVLIGTHSFLRDMGVEVPAGTRVHQALYAAIDGELAGVFAVSYGKNRNSAMALGALCGYRNLTPVLTCGDFMLTESFLRSRFGINTRRIAFPSLDMRKDLAAKKPEEESASLALTTADRFLGMAFAVSGARTLRTASILGVALHMVAGVLGLVIVALLALVGAEELLTAENLMLFELLWMIPGLLITEWTRNP